MERKLVSEMEAKLEEGTDGLFSLNKKGSPKLGLLLNCFGAEANTIQALRNLSSADLLSYGDSEVETMVWALPNRPPYRYPNIRYYRVVLSTTDTGYRMMALLHNLPKIL